MSNINSTKPRGSRPVAARAQVETGQDQGGALVEAPDDGLTDMQRAFVVAFSSDTVTAGNATQSAILAGYSTATAGEIARQLLGKPHIIAALDALLRDAIGSRLTVKAVRVIETILDSTEASLKLKGDMAAQIIQFSGLVERTKAVRAKDTGLSDKPMAEWTREELEAVVRTGAGILKAAAALPNGPILEGSAQHSAQLPGIADGKAAD